MSKTIIIRKATSHDKTFILENAILLVAFGPPEWRNKDEMIATDNEVLQKTIEENRRDKELFIFEEEGIKLGFIHLTEQVDYYTKQPNAHIADLVVCTNAQGKGIGKQLLNFAEEWAISRGYDMITLSVFPENIDALNLYKKIGYNNDQFKLLKKL